MIEKIKPLEIKKEEVMEVVEKTESGEWLKQVEKDEDGRLTWKRKREFIDPENPEKGLKYDYEKRFIEYDEDGNLLKEEGKNFLKGTGWEKSFDWEKKGEIKSERGKITEGPDRGHEWVKKFKTDKDGKVIEVRIEILEQGENPNKEPTGEVSIAKHFYNEQGEWVGKKWEAIDGPRKGKIVTKGEVPE